MVTYDRVIPPFFEAKDDMWVDPNLVMKPTRKQEVFQRIANATVKLASSGIQWKIKLVKVFN